MKKVLIMDTSILCVWLKVKDMETCGPDKDRWDYKRTKEKIDEEINKGTTFILPLATIIETGNHIAHSNGDRYSMAGKLKKVIDDASIVDVANYYAETGFEVEILTGDEGLKAYQPEKPQQREIPRRRNKK